MKEYIVSLNLLTSSATTVSQLSELLGLPDSMLTSRTTHQGLLWRVESPLEENVFMEDHLEAILSMLPSGIVLSTHNVIQKVYFSIGVLYDTATCTVNFSNALLKSILFQFPDIEIEMVCYPCEKESGEDN